MDFGINKRMIGAIALTLAIIGGGLGWAGVIPVWAAILAVPIATLAIGALLFVVLVMAWMAGGSH